MSASIKDHHKRKEHCVTRPPYRQGRQLKAVKVYTVSQESKYLQVQGVPSLGTEKQLVKLFQRYGPVRSWKKLDKYPCEEFTETYLFNYEDIQVARKAKKYLDDRSFYGGVLHIHYVPEYETVQDTREKLQQRRKDVAKRLRILEKEKAPETITSASSAVGDTGGVDSSSAASIPLQASEFEPEIKFVPQRNTWPELPGRPPDHFSGDVQVSDASNTRIQHTDVTLPEFSAKMPPRELPPPPQPSAVPPPEFYFPKSTVSGMSTRAQRMYGSGFPSNYGVTDTGDYYSPSNTPDPFQQSGNIVGAKVGCLSVPFHKARAPESPGLTTVRPASVGSYRSSSVQKAVEQFRYRQGPQRGRDSVVKSVSGNIQKSKVESSVTEGNVDSKSTQVIIKEHQPTHKKTEEPRFVPRTNVVGRKQVLPDELLNSVKDSVKSVPALEIDPVKALRKRKQDPINNKLRADAFILGDVKGPKLPRKEEELRRDFGESLSGDVTMETSVMDIRKKVMEFSVKALPPQLKRAKKKS